MTSDLTIADDRIAVTFDPVSGGIVRFVADETGLTRGDAAGASLFVVEVPRGGDRTVVIETSAQTLSHAELDGRHAVRLVWRDPVASNGERLGGEIAVGARIVDGSVRLSLSFHLDEGGVEAVRFPSLRGIRPSEGPLELRGVDYSTGTRVSLLPVFDSNAPYWGTTFPDYASGNLRPELVGTPTSPFVVLAGARGGFTVQPTERTLQFIGWRASLEPGFADSLLRRAGDDAAVTLDAIHFPSGDGTGATLPDMDVVPFAGTWERGLAAYLPTQESTRRSRAAWLDEPRSWLQVQLMSTEGEPRYDFDALVDIIEECAREGIGAIQIVGWNEGGQDGLVPQHRPAAKLGGEEGLRRALDRARELDVATVLYVKYVWVEKPGPLWDDLEPFVSRDANGQPYAQPGPVYHSSRKRYGIATPWYVPLCFGVEALRRRFADEVVQLADWGADGILADESLYHGRALLCFADDHGHEVGASAFSWDDAFVDDIRAALGERGESFVIAAEGAYDDQFAHYDVSYFRSASPSHRPLGRMLRPDARIVTALTGFDDRSMIAQCLLYGYALSLEPYNFKGRPGDMPATVALARQADALRARHRDVLWNGRLIVDHGVRAHRPDGSVHDLLTVWEGADGARAVVVATYDDEPLSLRLTGLDAGETDDLDGLRSRITDGRIDVSARGVSVVIPSSDPIGPQ
ncbi:DUF6259 domain-containing protein [Microbacterium trichothecenolyticum]|uniref:DUF6259 domain-containing protein n=1 Tax=Microbacterium trichothecenolyticum TaxID=69370 RepID=A0ABU0TV41_MICTR|nr:DUF6259 domain-containing protein [Microbacterium trichothecenolyticum]MDQ1123532.1 hypothetical protein [Microbacterium trichothecenolyticum]